ncbi:hypothetical protein E1295_32715 [Nonomuraea mesophila]|uniref:Biopolymer transporter Tol n=1 Tax=Nonomuraea mesophila TaxID=2530382 RepID=A0A4R5EY38_9ACTN|nr:PD40 domain-containing protein [Nonomuraea mesophila]TDE39903.1 hypothetical protein E1295_32715 [Nonomuraea mesophila]
MAVVTKDPETEATHVGYVDRAGKFIDLTGNQDFGNTPHEHNAAFARDGSVIWFTYRAPDGNFEQTKDRVASRPLTGDHKAVDHLEFKGVISEDMITLEGGRAVLAGEAFLSPDGKRLLAGGRVLDAPPEAQAVGPDLVDGGSIPCGDGWVDDDMVLRDTQDDRFATVDTTPGAEPGAPIVPENDHRNEPMVISPDGQRFVFLSAKGAARDHFISGTEPGSTPEKVERTGPFATLGDTAVFIEWR